MRTILREYDNRVEAGVLIADSTQRRACLTLDNLAESLLNQHKHWFRKSETPKGLYIWGGVGRGKSMLMDLFFELVPIDSKRRVHFHAFMEETHHHIKTWRRLTQRERKKSKFRPRTSLDDPIESAARRIAAKTSLLCFDEFQVTQIADAMILSRLFAFLFDEGLTVVATSNRVPEDLYSNGINRELFTPFISMLRDNCEVLHLDAIKDYRLDRLSQAPVWLTPVNEQSRSSIDETWQRLTVGAVPKPSTIVVKGRKLEIKNAAAGVARFTFNELCANPLGAADYLEIASQYHTILIDGIPVLTEAKRNEAARFVTLIDTLYESKVKLVATADEQPHKIYTTGDGAFEFQRTTSRLQEMSSIEYLASEHQVINQD